MKFTLLESIAHLFTEKFESNYSQLYGGPT